MKLDVLYFLRLLPWAHFRFSNPYNFLICGQIHKVWVSFSKIARNILVIKLLRFPEIFTFPTPAHVVSGLVDNAHYATSSLIWCYVRTCMTSFSAKNLPRLKLNIIKRNFKFLWWICHLFRLVKYAFFALLNEINGIFIPKIWITTM